MPDFRKIALEKFLNYEVIYQGKGLYLWQPVGTYFQVIPWNSIKQLGMKEDHFIKFESSHKIYGIREMSKAMLKKWYGIIE